MCTFLGAKVLKKVVSVSMANDKFKEAAFPSVSESQEGELHICSTCS